MKIRILVSSSSDYDGDVYFENSALLAARSLAKNNLNREILIHMDPSVFLKLAKPGVDEIKMENIQALLDSGQKFSSLPTLSVNEKGKVVSHEGRHRARALLAKGIKNLPVRFLSSNIRWQKQQDPSNFDYIKPSNWPKYITSEVAGAASYPFPINRSDIPALVSQ